jgi:hypothetical protein
MTKHIAGLILFTLIVGTSAIIAGIFAVAPEQANSVTVRDNYRVYKKKKRKKRCRRKCRHFEEKNVSVEIENAVYNKSSEDFIMNIEVDSKSNCRDSNILYLNFFVKDTDSGLKFTKTVTTEVLPTTKLIAKKLGMLSTLAEKGNVYVIAGNSMDSESFDETKAKPVLMLTED